MKLTDLYFNNRFFGKNMFRSFDAKEELGQKLLEVFQQVYIINLPERADRRREIEGQLARLGLSSAHPSISFFKAVKPSEAGGWPSVGAHGCFMSHLGVLEEALESRFDNVLILEDDMDWSPRFIDGGMRILDELGSKTWHFIHGGLRSPKAKSAEPVLRALSPEAALTQTHFIGLSAPAIASAAAYLKTIASRPPGHPEGGPMHVDGAYSWFRKSNPALDAYYFEPAIAVQRASRTDIHGNRWYDVMPGFAQAAGLFRGLRNRFNS
ncbi:glycosyltransferase family 25 protein [Roseobacter sp. AzwK-3b]|uniref:glycosyltransferase family 25 protein n=1 Tax=Roseobacter sp. AzwK-3b TaxID=351016 RepID=UPI0006816612|nr:glycosyltransferase family 25 protein [Roseobacter sp. AzwK-3b]